MIRIELGSPIEASEMREELPDIIQISGDEGVRYLEFSDEGFSLAMFAVSWAAGIPANLIASYLYDAMSKRSKTPPTRIIIDETHIKFDRGEMTEFIQRRIERHEGGENGK